MKYLVDPALCAGHGLCAAVAPDIYDLDDEGFNAAVGVVVPVDTAQEQAAREGSSTCPEQAIRLTD